MRTFSAQTLAALQSGSVALVQLLKLAFSGTPIYLNSSTWDLVWQRRYNLLTYSSTPNVWSPFVEGTGTASISVVVDATYGSVVRIIKTAGATGDRVGLVVGFSGLMGSSYTTSILCKTNVAGSSGSSTYVDAQKVGGGLVTTTTPVSGTVGVWSRAYATAFGSLAGTGNFYVLLSGPVGSSIDIAMPQLEPGELASTYTPTTTTSLTDPGLTYKGAYGLGQISAITDKPGEVQGITLELHGADAARISLALDDSDIVQGTPVEVRTALIDTSTYQILDAPLEWIGTMDTMSIADDGTSATIAVTCESRAVDLLRGNVVMYSDADQRSINATDGSFAYVVDQIDKPIVWPNREFFYK
jgi:hypothetical protein